MSWRIHRLGHRGQPRHSRDTVVSGISLRLINDEVVHGIPGKRVLKEGEIVSLDVGAIYKGIRATRP